MRWRKRNDDEASAQADVDAPRFEDTSDAWDGDVPGADDVSSDAADVDRDTWGEEKSAPPPPPTKPVQARADVPVDLGVLDDEDVARALRRIIARALAEDLGPAGDITSIATIPPATKGIGDVVAREAMVVSGLDAIREVYRQLDPRVTVTLFASDGDAVTAGSVLATLTGPVRTILTGERTALNLVGRLSGVATMARQYSRAVEGTGVAVRDTRKTTPGLRLLEKAAVSAGGASTHRLGLHDALLVKDNHVLATGSVREAARLALARSGGRHVQVEVTSLDQVDEALEEGIVDIMLDNFDVDGLREAVRHIDGRAAVEASGGVTLDNIAEVAATGVDRIAVGAITHHAVWGDVALDITEIDHNRLATHMPLATASVAAATADAPTLEAAEAVLPHEATEAEADGDGDQLGVEDTAHEGDDQSGADAGDRPTSEGDDAGQSTAADEDQQPGDGQSSDGEESSSEDGDAPEDQHDEVASVEADDVDDEDSSPLDDSDGTDDVDSSPLDDADDTDHVLFGDAPTGQPSDLPPPNADQRNDEPQEW